MKYSQLDKIINIQDMRIQERKRDTKEMTFVIHGAEER